MILLLLHNIHTPTKENAQISMAQNISFQYMILLLFYSEKQKKRLLICTIFNNWSFCTSARYNKSIRLTVMKEIAQISMAQNISFQYIILLLFYSEKQKKRLLICTIFNNWDPFVLLHNIIQVYDLLLQKRSRKYTWPKISHFST